MLAWIFQLGFLESIYHHWVIKWDPCQENRLSEVKVLIIDDVSMVSNDLLLHIHLQLTEIFAFKGNIPFAGIIVIAVGDFLQLPPVRARPVYAEYKNTWHNMDSLLGLFEIAEFTKVMRTGRQ